MIEAHGMIRVRFTTTRSALCGVHVSGLEYEVPAEFARLVVEQERCADYVTPESVGPPDREADRPRKGKR